MTDSNSDDLERRLVRLEENAWFQERKLLELEQMARETEKRLESLGRQLEVLQRAFLQLRDEILAGSASQLEREPLPPHWQQDK